MEGMWIIVTRGHVTKTAAIILPCCMHAPLWYDFAVLPINEQMVFTYFVNTAMYIVPCNLLCHRKYSGSDSVWLLRSQQGLAASSLAFLEHCYLVNKPKLLSLMLRYQEAREIMKRWREGPGHLSNYSNSDQTHEWGHLACPQASLQLTANAWMSPADIMWCRRTSHMSSAKLPMYITEWINNCCSNSWATYLAFSDYYSWSLNNADLNCVHLYADFFQ